MKPTLCILFLTFCLTGIASGRVIAWSDTGTHLATASFPGRTLVILPVASSDPLGPHLAPAAGTVIAESLSRELAARFEISMPDWDVLILPALLYGTQSAPASTMSALYETLAATFRGLHDKGYDTVVVIDPRYHSDSQTAIRQAIAFARRKWDMRILQPLASVVFGSDLRREFSETFANPDISFSSILTRDVTGGFIDTSLAEAFDPECVDATSASNLKPFPMTPGGMELELSLGATLEDIGATNGYVGYPNLATAEYGRKLAEMIVSRLADYAVRLANGDGSVYREARSLYSSMPMQGDRYFFTYPMPIGSGYDGLIVSEQVLAQSSGNLGFASLFGLGVDSLRFASKSVLVIGDFFLNQIEGVLGFDTVAGMDVLYGGLRYYFGYASPDLLQRPRARLLVYYKKQYMVPQPERGIYLSEGRYDGIDLRFEYDPLFNYPFGFRETDTVLHEPFYFKLDYEFGSEALGGQNYELLQCDVRFYINTPRDALQLACRTYFAADDLLYPEGTARLPDQKKIEGNSYINFRGYASLADNLFEKVLLQNVELRWALPLPPAWVFERYLVALGLDYGFGSTEWADLFAAGSFHADVNLSLFLKLNFLPFPLHADGAVVIAGPTALREANAHVGIGYVY